MKKEAMKTLIKDLIIILILGGLAAIVIVPDVSMGAGTKWFFWSAITGIPFGWKWASKLITAITLKGVGLKILFSALLGCIALYVVTIRDVIHFFSVSETE